MDIALRGTFDLIGGARKWLADHSMGILGFVVTSAFVPTMLSPTYLTRWAAIAVGVPLLATLDPRAVRGSVLWAIALLLAAAAMATTWASPDPMGGYLELMFVVMLCVTLIAGANLKTLDDVMHGVGAGLVLSSFIALFQISTPSDMGRDGMFGAAPTGLFGNSEVFAEFSALVFVWAIARPRPLIAAACLIPLMMCNSRIALFVAAVGALYAYRPASNIKTAAIAAGLIAAGVAAIFILGQGKLGSADHRLVLWLTTIASWTQFGHGLGWFQASYPQEEFAHSDALQAIAELGIMGLALLTVPIVAFTGNRGTNAERALFFAVCVEALVSFPLHVPASGFVAAIVAGYLVSRRPVVRMGFDLVGPDDGARIRRGQASYGRITGDGEGSLHPIPVRSVPVSSPEVCGAQDRLHPAAWPRGEL
jgi:hypothetical protein